MMQDQYSDIPTHLYLYKTKLNLKVIFPKPKLSMCGENNSAFQAYEKRCFQHSVSHVYFRGFGKSYFCLPRGDICLRFEPQGLKNDLIILQSLRL